MRDFKLEEFSSPTVDLSKTLGPGLSTPNHVAPVPRAVPNVVHNVVPSALPSVVPSAVAVPSISISTEKSPSIEKPPSTLCKACQSIFTDTSPQRPGQINHHGIDALRARAGRGCQLCLTIYMSMDPNLLLKFQNTVPNSQGIASFTPISRDQARLQFRYISATASDQESFNSTGSVQKQQSTVSVNSIKSNSGELRTLSVEMILVKPECTLSPDVCTDSC